MKKVLRVLGIVLWIVGVIWMAYIMGEVLSRADGYASLGNLVGPLIFHTVCMVAGGFCFAGTKKQVVPAAASQMS